MNTSVNPSMHTNEPIRFDDQVAIVTGAGGGIGRAFALALAQRGARVLVNDYGGDTSGHAGTAARAEQVVEEIIAAGGQAVANGLAVGSVASAQAIVAATIEAFGRVDILVNNAGIALRGLFDEPDDDAVDTLFQTNLLGPYALMRAVWPVMRKQAYGRILNISSNASIGIGSNAPYATTKAGLIGLSLDTAAEGQAAGILVNALMPTAYSRLIEQIRNKDFVAWFRHHFPADTVASAALYFLSRESNVTGQVLSAGGGRLARIAFAEGSGIVDTGLTPEAVRERLPEALAMDAPALLFRQADEMALYGQAFPWDVDGRGLPLSLDSVIPAGKEKSS